MKTLENFTHPPAARAEPCFLIQHRYHCVYTAAESQPCFNFLWNKFYFLCGNKLGFVLFCFFSNLIDNEAKFKQHLRSSLEGKDSTQLFLRVMIQGTFDAIVELIWLVYHLFFNNYDIIVSLACFSVVSFTSDVTSFFFILDIFCSTCTMHRLLLL